MANPSSTVRNFSPTSMGLASLMAAAAGTTEACQIDAGKPRRTPVTVTPGPGTSTLTLSSTARERMVSGPSAVGRNVKLQAVVPAARRQVAPPSTDTSTAATTPSASAAVPVTVSGVPTGTSAPVAGHVTTDVGGVWSADVDGYTRFDCSVAGSAPMSASTLAVACCIRACGAPESRGWVSSRPHAHWQVPVAHTRAPLGARYSVRRWVAGPAA